MMLGEVKSVEAALFGALEERDALLVDLLRRPPTMSLDVIEDPELDGHGASLP